MPPSIITDVTNVKETRTLSPPKLKDMVDPLQTPPRSLSQAFRRNSGNRGALQAERYRRAEAQLTQSLRRCTNEPSVFDLQIRTLRQATSSLAQFAEESGHRAKELTSLTADRTAVADLDPDHYRSMLSQRWKAERQHHLISQHIDVLQQTITSLMSAPSSARDTLSQGGYDINHVLGPEDKVRTNLVSFLCCPQRVTLIHRRRPRSRFLKTPLRPLNLNSPTSLTTTTNSPRGTIPTLAPETESSSGSSIDMDVRTPLTTDSFVESQQLQPQINCGEEVGTAVILTQPLPPPLPLDCSNLQVELPSYVHELLCDFDAQGKAVPATLKLEPECYDEPAIKSGLWPFKIPPKNPGHAKSHSQGTIRNRSSLKRLSELLTSPEVSKLRRKVNTKEDKSHQIPTNTPGLAEDADSALPTPLPEVTGKTDPKVTRRRFSFAKLQFGLRT